MGSNIGREIFGYCNGCFGSSYGSKRIEAEGFDWIVARDSSGEVNIAVFENGESKQKNIEQWSVDTDADE